ncbi:MAG: hypothetical protein KAX19_01585 [Candidatus Brocadiae bacterium]|nr:hypothetical protein [Candidatus Brocadiia bacterium]
MRAIIGVAILLSVVPALADAAAEVERIRGIMYTTWRNDYSNLERFGEALRSYGAAHR